MKPYTLAPVLILLVACQSMRENQSRPDEKKALIGKWELTSSICSSGRRVSGGPKGGQLDVKANQIRWTWMIGGTPESSTTSPWTLQNGVITTNLGADKSGIEAEMAEPQKLVLKIPLDGVPGQCPKNDVMVSEYRRLN